MNLFKFILTLSLSVFLISLQSCSDPCESITCLHDGMCANGSCECPPGYTGSFCQYCPAGYSGADCATYDSCYNVTCQNGGTCISGTCDCPLGYTGTYCETRQTPISMTINKIELTTYPTATSSGNSWDGGSGPDVFITINSGTSSNQFSFVSGDIFTDANGTLLTYTSGLPFTLSSLYSYYTISAWDDDGGVNLNDYIGGFYFDPSSNGRLTLLPSSFTMTGGGIAIRLYVTWNF